MADQAQDGIIRRVCLAHKLPGIAVQYIRFRKRIFAVLHQLFLDDILYFLHLHRRLIQRLNRPHNPLDLPLRNLFLHPDFVVRLADRHKNLIPVVLDNAPIPFNNFHCVTPFLCYTKSLLCYSYLKTQ